MQVFRRDLDISDNPQDQPSFFRDEDPSLEYFFLTSNSIEEKIKFLMHYGHASVKGIRSPHIHMQTPTHVTLE